MFDHHHPYLAHQCVLFSLGKQRLNIFLMLLVHIECFTTTFHTPLMILLNLFAKQHHIMSKFSIHPYCSNLLSSFIDDLFMKSFQTLHWHILMA